MLCLMYNSNAIGMLRVIAYEYDGGRRPAHPRPRLDPRDDPERHRHAMGAGCMRGGGGDLMQTMDALLPFLQNFRPRRKNVVFESWTS